MTTWAREKADVMLKDRDIARLWVIGTRAKFLKTRSERVMRIICQRIGIGSSFTPALYAPVNEC
jgi:hypothetical protein